MSNKILKIKGMVYRYTGVYLANKEEAHHMSQPSTQFQIAKWASDPEMEMNTEDATGLAIGSWQVRYGFSRPLCFLRFNKPAFFWKPIAWVVECYRALSWDVKRLVGK